MDKIKETDEFKEMMKNINELSLKTIEPKDIKQNGLNIQLKGLDALRGVNKKAAMAALIFNSLKNEEKTSKDNTEK